MNSNSSNYSLLIRKLDAFIRKYYLNKVIKGILYTIGLVILLFLLFAVLEHFFYFSAMIRKVIYFGFFILAYGTLSVLVLYPLFQMFRLGKVIGKQKAAEIIGKHFSSVEDKLLNILQLKNQANNADNKALIEASIDQKSNKLGTVQFAEAVNLKNNRRYLKYAVIPFVLLASVLFLAPNIVKESTERIVNNDVEFVKPSPFNFYLLNKDLEAIQNENLNLKIGISGNTLPKQANIRFNDFSYKLNKVDLENYTYQFTNLQKDLTFTLEADGVVSEPYKLTVIPKPSILSFDVKIDYPAYTKLQQETINNTGDIYIAAGSKVTWTFKTKNTEKIDIKFDASDHKAKRIGQSDFSFSKKFLKDDVYTIYVSNDRLPKADSIAYNISVTQDLFPSISVEEIKDSTDKSIVYFLGDAEDDYGLNDIFFKFRKKEDPSYTKIPIESKGTEKNKNYTYFWNIKDMALEAGDEIYYHFEAWDNDMINGSKSGKTIEMFLKLPTVREMENKTDDQNKDMKEELAKNLDEVKKLKEEVDEMRERIVEKKNLNWEDKKAIEKLIQKHKNVQSEMQNVQEQFQQNLQQEQEYKSYSEDIKKKKEKLQELFDQVMTDEMKEMMKKLEDMLEELDQQDALEELEEMELTDEQLEEELDKMLELFKQLEFEEKMTETIDKLNELAEEQEDLAEETKENESGDLSKEEEKQEKLKEKFDEVKEDLEKLEEMSKELAEPQEMDEFKKMEEEISKEMDNASDQLEKNNKKKGSQKQQNSADKMQQMANAMQMQMNEMQQEQMEEDMEAIRQLLENLVRLSIDQEEVMDSVSITGINNAKYKSLLQRQYKLKDDAQMVKDSIVALSKRKFEIESFVSKEIAAINKNLKVGLDKLEERKKNEGLVNQQKTMTGFNNLALMFNEALQQMQMQMSNKMPGNQNCNKPGGAPKPGMSGLKEAQQKMNEQLKKMLEEMSKGEKPGKKGKGKDGQGGMSKQIAKMAQRQAAIRDALQKMDQQNNKDGKKSLGDLGKIADEMEQTEEDLLNKNISIEMLKRQQEILTNLLKAEEAERQREFEDKRQAETAQEREKKIPPQIAEYLKKREEEIQMYKTVPPGLKPFYKDLVERYFNKISFN